MRKYLALIIVIIGMAVILFGLYLLLGDYIINEWNKATEFFRSMH